MVTALLRHCVKVMNESERFAELTITNDPTPPVTLRAMYLQRKGKNAELEALYHFYQARRARHIN